MRGGLVAAYDAAGPRPRRGQTRVKGRRLRTEGLVALGMRAETAAPAPTLRRRPAANKPVVATDAEACARADRGSDIANSAAAAVIRSGVRMQTTWITLP